MQIVKTDYIIIKHGFLTIASIHTTMLIVFLLCKLSNFQVTNNSTFTVDSGLIFTLALTLISKNQVLQVFYPV